MCLQITGTLTVAPNDPPLPLDKYVYQRTWKGGGNVAGDPTKTQQIRRWVAGTNPDTPGQQARRAIFADAVAAWHSASPTEKKAAQRAGSKRALAGYHWFISEWLRTHR